MAEPKTPPFEILYNRFKEDVQEKIRWVTALYHPDQNIPTETELITFLWPDWPDGFTPSPEGVLAIKEAEGLMSTLFGGNWAIMFGNGPVMQHHIGAMQLVEGNCDVLSIQEIHQKWMKQDPEPDHPLKPLIDAWTKPPIPVKRNTRPDRIIPTGIAQVSPDYGQSNRGLFAFASRADKTGQMVIPGFEIEQEGPALPLALYDLGVGSIAEQRSQAAPLALRLWMESVLSVPLDQRTGDHPVSMQVKFRDLLKQMYPGDRQPRPGEYYPRLMKAMEALDSPEARIPWEDTDTGQGGLRRVVSVSDIPRGPGKLDDWVTLTVHLPPGAKDGPIVSPMLPHWGIKSAPAYRALIGLAFRWHEPGRTRIPVRHGKHWIYSQDPARYQAMTDDELIRLCFPTSTIKARRVLLQRANKTIGKLHKGGELQIIGRKILPPKPKKSE